MSDDNKNVNYGAQSIKVIEGLEAVRKRPAMYIGSVGIQGLHHLVYELVDNSVDEALAGYCTDIKVIIHEDGSCSVEDNGRGIPTGIHPSEGISAAEVALTKLHAGGKFDKDSYKYSGGLHGVGVSVVNALSSKLELNIFQNGKIYKQEYAKGKPLYPLKEIGITSKRGTLIRFYPDNEIFKESTTFNFNILAARLRELAFLNKGVSISIEDIKEVKKENFFFEGGIISFIEHINSKKNILFNDIIYKSKEDENSFLEIALQYNDSYSEQLFSFVNNINTQEGGTHVTGFKAALTKACNKKAQEFGILKENESFSSEDVREGLVCIINLKIAEPQFEGQTKTKLGNSEVKGLIESFVFSFLDTYFEENPIIAKKILNKSLLAYQAREAAKKAREITRKKNILESVVLPGKLADCSIEDPSQTELFIVEGDSAGGSAKQARDRNIQAILPLKGKILNVEKARFDKILSNDEIKALISAIGGGIGDNEFNIDKIRYHKIILMTDADVDGAHIRTLLLTFFFRYMKPLIEKGYLYIAEPPLYKAKIGKKEEYLKDEKAFTEFIFNWAKENLQLYINNERVLNKLEFNNFIDNLLIYKSSIESISYKFKIEYSLCYQLIDFILKNSNIDFNNIVELEKQLGQYFKSFKISLYNDKDILKLQLSKLNNNWSIDKDFFLNPDIDNLKNIYSKLKYINSWKLSIIDKNKFEEGQDLNNLINSIIKLSKNYMSIQRYKGLGEMNPEQLWDTAMNIKTRSLLQVSIGDYINADSWFDTLMGDDVSGRKNFIEEYGHFTKNIDI